MERFQKQLDKMFKERGWEYWSPLTILARLMEESGELAREINHLYGEKKKRGDESYNSVELEIGDIAYTIICLANSLGYSCHIDQGRSMDGDYGASMKALARLGLGIGQLIGVVDLYVDRRGTDPSVNEVIQGNVTYVILLLERVAKCTNCDLATCIEKSIAKVAARDKDRFPEGK